MTNEEIAACFDEYAMLLSFDDANSFRVRAYRNAARMLRRCGDEMADLVSSGADLSELPTIGDELERLIKEAVSTGDIQSLAALRRAAPPGAVSYLEIDGVGPKRAAALSKAFGALSFEELYRAVLDHEIRDLPGFGPVSEERIGLAIDKAMNRRAHKRFARETIEGLAQSLLAWLRNASSIDRAVLAGSYRRGSATLGDLDVVVVTDQPPEAINRFVTWDRVDRVISSGTSKATILLSNSLQVDLRTVGADSFGAMLLYFTGSKSFGIALRRHAKDLGYKLNEYGLWQGDIRIAGNTEEEIFTALHLQFRPPTQRNGPIDLCGTSHEETVRHGIILPSQALAQERSAS